MQKYGISTYVHYCICVIAAHVGMLYVIEHNATLYFAKSMFGTPFRFDCPYIDHVNYMQRVVVTACDFFS